MSIREREGTAPFMRRGVSKPGVELYAPRALVYRLECGRKHARSAPLLNWLRAYASVEPSRYRAPWSRGTGVTSVVVCSDPRETMMIVPRGFSHATGSRLDDRSLYPAELVGTRKDLDALKFLKAGWNGYDVAAPRIEAIHHAMGWIGRMYDDVSRSELAWRAPHVAADENGDVTFEWWHGDRELTVYVSADGDVSYLKDWGLDMEGDMEDGLLSTPEQRHDIWAWFVQQ